MKTLLERWRALAGDGADALGERLIAAYAEPLRRYHDQSHVTWLLEEAERRADLISDPAFVGYAIWFHDAVYQPGQPDNETLSAAWAREALADEGAPKQRILNSPQGDRELGANSKSKVALGISNSKASSNLKCDLEDDPDFGSHLRSEDALAERVAHVIEMTRNHAAGDAAGDAALFLDMDIAILGAPWETYCAYAAGIRGEYPHIVDPAFAAGRGAFLDAQLARPRTFRTDLYEQELGEQARANMAWEREEMRRGRMVKA